MKKIMMKPTKAMMNTPKGKKNIPNMGTGGTLMGDALKSGFAGADPISLGLKAGKLISDTIPVDEYGVAKTGGAAYAKSLLDPIGSTTQAIGNVISDPGKANFGDYASIIPGVGAIVSGLRNKGLAKKRDDMLTQQKIAANTAAYNSDVNTGAAQDMNYLNGQGQGFKNETMFAPDGIRVTDTTGFAKRSKDLLLSNVNQSGNGFIGNKRNKDISQASNEIVSALGASDGTPIPFYNTVTPNGIMMKSISNKNTNVNLGTDKAFADYVSTLGVTEANKIKNPKAYEQAKLEFAKRVNIKPVNDMTNLAQGGRIPTELQPQGQLITAPNGSTIPMHGQPGGDVPIQNAQGQTMVNAEPGEVLANLPDETGKDVPTVLSKRLGYAQEFQQLSAEKAMITAKIISSKDRELKAKLSLQLRELNAKIDQLGLQQDQENGGKSVDANGQVSQEQPIAANGIQGTDGNPWTTGTSIWGKPNVVTPTVSPIINKVNRISIANKKPFVPPTITPEMAGIVASKPIDYTMDSTPIDVLKGVDTTTPDIQAYTAPVNKSFLEKNGVGISKAISFATPLIANAMTNNYAKKAYDKVNELQAPVYKSTPIDTKVDTSAAINNLDQSANQAIRGINNSFSDPTVAQAYSASVLANKNAAIPAITSQANQRSNQLKMFNAQGTDRAGQLTTEAASTLAQLKAQAFGELQGVKSSTGQAAAQSLLNLIKESNGNQMNAMILSEIAKAYDPTGKLMMDKVGPIMDYIKTNLATK